LAGLYLHSDRQCPAHSYRVAPLTKWYAIGGRTEERRRIRADNGASNRQRLDPKMRFWQSS